MTEVETEICAVCGSRILGSAAFCLTCAFTSVFDESQAPDLAGDEEESAEVDDVASIGPDVAGPEGYRFRGVVGRGGMGTVYKAVRTIDGREMALKFISIFGAKDDRGSRRFQREADALISLNHPNIVKVRDVGSWRGRQFIAMDWIDGVGFDIWVEIARKDAAKLGDAIRTKVEAEILRWSVVALKAVAKAVAHAHERGFIHRDLKPGNILIDRLDDPHVVDFGLARQVDESNDLTLTGEALGTAGFMSPEQALGARHQVSESTDVYALGAILHWLLFGKAPGEGEGDIGRGARAGGGRAAINADVDRDLCAIALRCLRRDPERRYSSAGQVSDELRRWLRGKRVLAAVKLREEQIGWLPGQGDAREGERSKDGGH